MPETSQAGLLSALIESLSRRRRVLMAGVVLVGLAWVVQGAWRLQKSALRSDPRFLLTAGAVHVIDQPPWVPVDVRNQAIARAGMQGPLCLLESRQLSSRLAEAFRLEPWVKKVNQVELLPPNRVRIDLTWRKPLAVVPISGSGRVELAPLDDEGVRLPSQGLPAAQLRRLPRITRVNRAPPEGDAWTDRQVTGAVRLIVRLADDWSRLSLADVAPSERPEIRGEQQFYRYDLLTVGGTRIVWGAAPEAPAPDEAPFEVKLARLKQFVAENRVELDGYRSPEVIDLRYGLDTKRRIAKSKDKDRTAKKEPSPEERTELVK